MSINWPKLVAQGRAKAMFISWTDEEFAEINKLKGAEKVALIVKLRGEMVETKKPEIVAGADHVLTPEEIKTEKERAKAEKKATTDAEKARVKAEKEAAKAAKEGK